jgi:two-component system copper resistance phosphate regulon response regulator CusR
MNRAHNLTAMSQTNPHPLLVIEDDLKLGRHLRAALQAEGYEVSLVASGGDALAIVAKEAFDLLIVDWMLPDTDGPALVKIVRQTMPRVPVIMLTARDAIEDRVDGLDAGADDYVTKPFALAELLARIRTLLRRSRGAVAHLERIRGLEIDLLARRSRYLDRDLELTPREFDLLAFLVNAQGEIVSRTTLQRDVWQQENRFTSLDNVIDVHLANLRRKLREAIGKDIIETVRGVGYRLKLPSVD